LSAKSPIAALNHSITNHWFRYGSCRLERLRQSLEARKVAEKRPERAKKGKAARRVA
jgi:hypothetical protein